MPHLGDAAHARADLQSKRGSVHAREARWLRRTERRGAADYSLTTKSPQLAASRIAMQNASVREQFRKIRPRTSTFRTCCAAAHRVRRVQPPQRAPRNGLHAAQRAPTEPERRPSVHVGVHAVCVHARACVCDRRASVAWTAPRSSTRW